MKKLIILGLILATAFIVGAYFNLPKANAKDTKPHNEWEWECVADECGTDHGHWIATCESKNEWGHSECDLKDKPIKGDRCKAKKVACPIPTPEPSPVTEYKDVGYGIGGSPSFPHDTKVYTNQCVGDAPKAPIFSATRISPTQVRLNWWPVENVRKYAMIYGYNSENEMGADNISSQATEFTINGLEANKYIFVRMLAEGNNFCPAWSVILDP